MIDRTNAVLAEKVRKAGIRLIECAAMIADKTEAMPTDFDSVTVKFDDVSPIQFGVDVDVIE